MSALESGERWYQLCLQAVLLSCKCSGWSFYGQMYSVSSFPGPQLIHGFLLLPSHLLSENPAGFLDGLWRKLGRTEEGRLDKKGVRELRAEMERLVEREEDGANFLAWQCRATQEEEGREGAVGCAGKGILDFAGSAGVTKPVDGEEGAWSFSVRTSERDENKDSNPLKLLPGSWTGPLNIEMRPQEICLYLGYTINVETWIPPGINSLCSKKETQMIQRSLNEIKIDEKPIALRS